MPAEFPRFTGSGDAGPESDRESPETIPDLTGKETKLRGTLIENLRAKQEEDEETSSLLRGKLLEQIRVSNSADLPAPSRLRGTLLGKAPAEGRVPDPSAEAREPDPFSKEWMEKQTFVQRDTGDEFVVAGFNEGRNGTLVTLVCPKNSARTSQLLDRFAHRGR